MGIIWHRDDLRVHDNPALVRAKDTEVYPVFVVDPWFYGEGANCDTRVEFVLSSVEALAREYERLGTSLSILHGKSVKRLTEVAKHHDEAVYYNLGVHAGYPDRRDRRASEEGFTGVGEDGIRRDKNPRDGWKKSTQEWFNSEPYEAPGSLGDNPIESDTTIDEVRERYSIEPTGTVPSAGEEAALNRLSDFLDRIEEYPSGISPPHRAETDRGTSHLSPHISVGSLSLRVTYQRAEEKKEQEGIDTGSVDMFTERLFWNRHFTQKLQDNPSLTYEATNPVFRGMNRNSYEEGLTEAWKEGKTGYPLVDASMRALDTKGWLNFRMRAMVASFFTYILKQPWWLGARHMRSELIDGDTAINYAQWQMQSGLVGVHPNRIYNPTKQVRENDPEGEYIRKYVPELAAVPDEYIAEPWEMPGKVQKQVGVVVGEDYPEPVVDFNDEAKRARQAYSSLADRAQEALSDPEVYRKASLPERRGRAELTETSYPEAEQEGSQTELDRFG